jgi:membrane protein YdbS with pleckstrin-like domain
VILAPLPTEPPPPDPTAASPPHPAGPPDQGGPPDATPDLELRPPRHRVSPRAIRYWTARAAGGWLLVLTAQVVWLLATPADRRWHVLALAVTVVVAVAHVTVMPRWRYAVHRWEAAPHAVYTQAGWFDQERRIAPISRIQTVDTERGPLEQLFGLSSVTVTTASAAGALEINGLDRAVADRLVDELTAETQAEDAT